MSVTISWSMLMLSHSHLMFRDGLLSPRSKLLPQVPESPFPYLLEEGEADSLDRSKSVLSVVSTGRSSSCSRRSLMLMHPSGVGDDQIRPTLQGSTRYGET